MTSKRVMAGFAAGAAIAGMVVGAARLTGVSEPATAVAEVPAEVHPVAAAAVVAKAQPEPEPKPPERATPEPARSSERWRAPGRPAGDVSAGVLARVAKQRGVERAEPCEVSVKVATGTGSAAEPKPKTGGQVAAVRSCAPADRAMPDEGIESVEIEWHGTPAQP
jgi:hypothetical protein